MGKLIVVYGVQFQQLLPTYTRDYCNRSTLVLFYIPSQTKSELFPDYGEVKIQFSCSKSSNSKFSGSQRELNSKSNSLYLPKRFLAINWQLSMLALLRISTLHKSLRMSASYTYIPSNARYKSAPHQDMPVRRKTVKVRYRFPPVKCVSLPKKFPSIIGFPLKRFLPGHLTMKIHSILLTLNSKMC